MLRVREIEISLHNSSGGPSICAPYRNIADNAAQMDVHKTTYPTLQRKCPMLG